MTCQRVSKVVGLLRLFSGTLLGQRLGEAEMAGTYVAVKVSRAGASTEPHDQRAPVPSKFVELRLLHEDGAAVSEAVGGVALWPGYSYGPM